MISDKKIRKESIDFLVREAQSLIEKYIYEDETSGKKHNEKVIKLVEESDQPENEKYELMQTFGENKEDAYLQFLASNANSIISYVANYRISFGKKSEVLKKVLEERVKSLEEEEEEKTEKKQEA